MTTFCESEPEAPGHVSCNGGFKIAAMVNIGITVIYEIYPCNISKPTDFRSQSPNLTLFSRNSDILRPKIEHSLCEGDVNSHFDHVLQGFLPFHLVIQT